MLADERTRKREQQLQAKEIQSTQAFPGFVLRLDLR